MIWGLGLALEFFWRLGTNTWQALYLDRWGILLGVFVLGGLSNYRERLGGLFWPLLYIGIQVILVDVGAWPVAYEPLESVVRDGMMSAGLVTAAFVFFMVAVDRRTREFLMSHRACIALPLAIGLLAARLNDPIGGKLLYVLPFGNPSMQAILVALCLIGPFPEVSRTGIRRGIYAVCLASVILSISYSALAVLALGLGWGYLPKRWMRWGMLIPTALAAYLSTFYFPNIWNGRVQLWDAYTKYVREMPWQYQVFGTGFGSTRAYLANSEAGKEQVFIWLHNDFLQWSLDMGVVGCALIYFAVGYLLYHATRWDRARLVAIGAAMVGGFPWHWPLHAFYCWLVVSLILDKGEKDGI